MTTTTSGTPTYGARRCGPPAARGILKNVLVRAMLIRSTKIRASITEPLFRIGRPAVVQRVLNTYHPIRYRTPLHNLGVTLSSFEIRRLRIIRQSLVRTAQRLAKTCLMNHFKHVRTAAGCVAHSESFKDIRSCLWTIEFKHKDHKFEPLHTHRRQFFLGCQNYGAVELTQLSAHTWRI